VLAGEEEEEERAVSWVSGGGNERDTYFRGRGRGRGRTFSWLGGAGAGKVSYLFRLGRKK